MGLMGINIWLQCEIYDIYFIIIIGTIQPHLLIMYVIKCNKKAMELKCSVMVLYMVLFVQMANLKQKKKNHFG